MKKEKLTKTVEEATSKTKGLLDARTITVSVISVLAALCIVPLAHVSTDAIAGMQQDRTDPFVVNVGPSDIMAQEGEVIAEAPDAEDASSNADAAADSTVSDTASADETDAQDPESSASSDANAENATASESTTNENAADATESEDKADAGTDAVAKDDADAADDEAAQEQKKDAARIERVVFRSQTVPYDGTAKTITATAYDFDGNVVNGVVRYFNNKTQQYDLSTPPTFVDAGTYQILCEVPGSVDPSISTNSFDSVANAEAATSAIRSEATLTIEATPSSVTDSTTGITVTGDVFEELSSEGYKVEMSSSEVTDIAELQMLYQTELTTSFDVYEITLDLVNQLTGTVEPIVDNFGTITISIPVDPAYNGRTARVIQLHDNGDGSESQFTYSAVASKGFVTISGVTKLSRFIVAFDDSIVADAAAGTAGAAGTASTSSSASGSTTTARAGEAASVDRTEVTLLAQTGDPLNTAVVLTAILTAVVCAVLAMRRVRDLR